MKFRVLGYGVVLLTFWCAISGLGQDRCTVADFKSHLIEEWTDLLRDTGYTFSPFLKADRDFFFGLNNVKIVFNKSLFINPKKEQEMLEIEVKAHEEGRETQRKDLGDFPNRVGATPPEANIKKFAMAGNGVIYVNAFIIEREWSRVQAFSRKKDSGGEIDLNVCDRLMERVALLWFPVILHENWHLRIEKRLEKIGLSFSYPSVEDEFLAYWHQYKVFLALKNSKCYSKEWEPQGSKSPRFEIEALQEEVQRAYEKGPKTFRRRIEQNEPDLYSFFNDNYDVIQKEARARIKDIKKFIERSESLLDRVHGSSFRATRLRERIRANIDRFESQIDEQERLLRELGTKTKFGRIRTFYRTRINQAILSWFFDKDGKQK